MTAPVLHITLYLDCEAYAASVFCKIRNRDSNGFAKDSAAEEFLVMTFKTNLAGWWIGEFQMDWM